MNYTMRAPCSSCPFRWDVPGFLTAERAAEITEALLRGFTFQCHKTITRNEEDYDGESVVHTEQDQHCAGALIMLEHMELPNQLMRIAERLGMYDRTRLQMDAPVFTSDEEFMSHHHA